MEKKEVVINFDNFTFKYFSQMYPTLKDINLKINKGEKVLIAGPSGSGKSTIGHCLNGLIPFSYKGDITGSVTVGSLNTKDGSIFKLSKEIGTVLQDSDSQFVALSVAEDIAFSLENDCIPVYEMKKRVSKIAKMINLEDLLNHSPQELSGGQKQRTALAGIMVDDVDILLFDEPLANLDPETGKYAIEIIDEIHKTTNKTIVIIEHRIEDVLYKDIDRVIIMNEGEVAADMNPHELMASNILKSYGIREPLYVTLLKYAGVNLTEDMKPAYIDTIEIDKYKDQILKWFRDVKISEPTNNKDTVLEVVDLKYAYNKRKPILKGISFAIKAGEMISIVGNNGAGKSTLSKIICGFENGYKGNIKIKGKDVKKQSISKRAETVGYVMQNPNHMITEVNIFDEIALGLKHRKVSESEINKRVDKVLEICGLTKFKKWPISALSYGQKKRVTIAAILVLNPEIIILDEPTAGQDYHHYTEIMNFLKEINESLNITIILITHDMHLMMEYTKRSIVLSDGLIIKDSDSSDVLTNIDVIEEAALKETSIYHIANAINMKEPKLLVDAFISYEREVHSSE